VLTEKEICGLFSDKVTGKLWYVCAKGKEICGLFFLKEKKICGPLG